jgi:hypothetical protein
MAGKIIRWRCQFRKCSFDGNWEYVNAIKQVLFCKKCGMGNQPSKAPKPSDDWLPCLPLRGLDLRIPNGSPGEGWVDGNADGPFTVEQYMEEYNLNPEVYWYFIHPTYQRPADLIPPPLPLELANVAPVLEPETNTDKILKDAYDKIDAMRNKGEITEMTYIGKMRYFEKLREWRTLELITEDRLKNSINKSLSKK